MVNNQFYFILETYINNSKNYNNLSLPVATYINKKMYIKHGNLCRVVQQSNNYY